MSISTAKLNKITKEAICIEYGVDYYHCENIADGSRFPPIRVTFSIGGITSIIIVPSMTREKTVGDWPLEYEIEVYDYEEMENLVKQAIRNFKDERN